MKTAADSMIPATAGFSVPGEWQPHEATWLAWPYDDDLWVGYLDAVRNEFATLINTLAKYERVELLVANKECENDARKRLRGNIKFHSIEYSDIWLRDSGPIFISNSSGELLLTNWEFNGWGNKYNSAPDNKIPDQIARFLGGKTVSPGIVMEGGSLEPNGEGIFLTTKQCLLSKERNPSLREKDIERYLAEYLGAKKIVWLGEGLENDHTDGHIDTISRFINPSTVVTVFSEDISDPNYDTMEANFDILSSATDLTGKPFTVIRLPLPINRLELEGERLAPSYANFYICNDAVLVPQYNDPNDLKAIAQLKPLFPDRKVIGLPGRALITGGGSFHCVTQQQPKGQLWREI